MAEKMVKEQEFPSLLRPNFHSPLISKREEKRDLAGEKEKSLDLEKAIELVMNPIIEGNYIPHHLVQKKRRKKKQLQF